MHKTVSVTYVDLRDRERTEDAEVEYILTEDAGKISPEVTNVFYPAGLSHVAFIDRHYVQGVRSQIIDEFYRTYKE